MQPYNTSDENHKSQILQIPILATVYWCQISALAGMVCRIRFVENGPNVAQGWLSMQLKRRNCARSRPLEEIVEPLPFDTRPKWPEENRGWAFLHVCCLWCFWETYWFSSRFRIEKTWDPLSYHRQTGPTIAQYVSVGKHSAHSGSTTLETCARLSLSLI